MENAPASAVSNDMRAPFPTLLLDVCEIAAFWSLVTDASLQAT